MYRSILPFARFISASLALILLLSAALSIPPRRAYAGGDGTLLHQRADRGGNSEECPLR